MLSLDFVTTVAFWLSALCQWLRTLIVPSEVVVVHDLARVGDKVEAAQVEKKEATKSGEFKFGNHCRSGSIRLMARPRLTKT